MIRKEVKAIGSGSVRLSEDSSASPTMSSSRATWSCAGVLLSLSLGGAAWWADEADLIVQHGKDVTVDNDLSVRRALAVKGDRLL
jgi:hypothetical protein